MFGSSSSKYTILSDESLLERYHKTGNLEYLGTLYHRYMHLVYGVALKYLNDPESSKDAVMQIFEILVEKIRHHEIRNFKSWLYTVTKNYCLGLIRKNKIKQNIEEFVMESDGILHHNGASEEQNQRLLSQAVANLSEHQHKCIKMFFYQNLSYQEIAEETGYDFKKVKSYIQNGKRNLKIFLDQHGKQ